MEYHKLGFIKGGKCEERLTRRHSRAEGSRLAWDDIKNDEKFVAKKGSKFQIIQEPKGRKIGDYGGGNQELGYLRMVQMVLNHLAKKKTKFTLDSMEKWIEGIAALVLGVESETPLSIITPDEKFSWHMCPPKRDDDLLYEKLYGVPAGLVTTN